MSVTVNDAKTGEAFEVMVRDRERALDVYHHPFAYAAQCRGGDQMSVIRRTSRRPHNHQADPAQSVALVLRLLGSLAVGRAEGKSSGAAVRGLAPGCVSKRGVMLRRIDKVNVEG